MYVKTGRHPDLPPPPSEAGVLGWLRKNLFSSWLNTLLTLAGAALIAFTVPPFIRWAILDATWVGDSREACLNGDGGACWVFIKVRLGLIMYGFYPEAERWRIDLAALLLAGGGAPLIAGTLLPFGARTNRIVLAALPAAAALAALALRGPAPALVASGFFLAPWALSRVHLRAVPPFGSPNPLPRRAGLAALGLAAFAAVAVPLRLSGAGGEIPLGLAAAMAALLLPAMDGASTQKWRFALLLAVFPFIAYVLFLGGALGLAPIETDRWGGMFLTLTIAGVGIATALPIGILLALGRRSEMPVVKAMCVGFIEFVRGVPLISVLFMVSVMLPLTLPAGTHFDKLLRALIGVSLFYAAYMAEVVRGGLAAIPRGQHEAAEALGLRYWRSMRLVILPQALRLVIPGITNTFLGLMKDTTLVAVINLMDVLGILKSALADTRWLGFTKEAYIFAGAAFWVLCFGLSRYSMHLERRLNHSKR